MIFVQSHSRILRKRCKSFTGKRDRNNSVFQELKAIMMTRGRRLRSDKTLINKTLNGINKSVKKSGTTKENKKVTTRIVKSTSTNSRSRKPEKIKEEAKKENVSRTKKVNISENRSARRTVLSSKKKVNIPEGKRLKNKTSFRQMSLKESFSNQETLSNRLRPRKESRNYCEDTVLQQNNKKSMKKTSENENFKVPVYKSIKPNEESSRSGSDIYDFKFDADDSKERLTAKRKRRIINRVRQKRVKKTVPTKQKQVQPTTETKVSHGASPENIAKITTDNKQCVPTSFSDNEKKHLLLPSTITSNKSENDTKQKPMLPPSTNVNTAEIKLDNVPLSADSGMESDGVQSLETNCPPLKKVISDSTDKQPNIKSRPTIISIENIDNKRILMDTPVKSNTENFAPFRKTNIFNSKALLQYGSMVNHSLINKSFSPIKKAFDNFDPGSPWRLSSLNTFSQVKNLFQSTPQPRKLEILQGKIKQNVKDQAQQVMETVKKRDVLATVNENAGTQKTSSKSHIIKTFGQSVRKFGTEITNLEHSVQSSNNTAITEQYEETSNKELRFPVINLQNTIDTMGSNSPVYSEMTEDKENTAPKRLKSKKLSKKRSRNVNSTSFSLQKEKGVQDKENISVQSEPVNVETFSTNSSHTQKEKDEQGKENFDPQPGPSGLQKYKSPNNKPLQQTNLNAFLNITEMPESTRISTVHGIFDDAHSTPINGKPVKKIDTKNTELDNAFGFEEDSEDGNLDVSPIYSDLQNNALQKKCTLVTNVVQTRKNSAFPIRLIPQEIKKTIELKNIDNGRVVGKNAEKVKENENENGKEKENENVQVKVQEPFSGEKVKPVDMTSFSDTFDVLTENQETKEKPSVMPLFTDLEPVHFVEPPKRSYRRKRNVRFNFTESSSENDEELEDGEPERKRKKHGKLKKVDDKRMKEWLKSINETFQEIDHYELVVE